MTELPKLYPNHRHQWTVIPQALVPALTDNLACCTVCGFTVPRSAAKLDGEPATKETKPR